MLLIKNYLLLGEQNIGSSFSLHGIYVLLPSGQPELQHDGRDRHTRTALRSCLVKNTVEKQFGDAQLN